MIVHILVIIWVIFKKIFKTKIVTHRTFKTFQPPQFRFNSLLWGSLFYCLGNTFWFALSFSVFLSPWLSAAVNQEDMIAIFTAKLVSECTKLIRSWAKMIDEGRRGKDWWLIWWWSSVPSCFHLIVLLVNQTTVGSVAHNQCEYS